jgi:secondary thiamine-phosphate synthase enzyme
VSNCSNNGNGWACTLVPDEHAAYDAEIGRLQSENEKLKQQLADSGGTVSGKTDDALPKSDSLKKAEPKAAESPNKIEIPLPSDQDMNRMMSFLQQAWRRLVDKAREGAVALFIRHTSASLTIQENADPSVLRDLITALDRFAPEDAGWSHVTEGPDDMPAHVKTMLTATSLHVPVLGGELALGTWQAIYLIEHRACPHRREVVLQFIGGVG